MKVSGKKFTNSTTCFGESFTSVDAPLDLAEIAITGRYPESGWACNHECHEMVRILSGSGSLILRDSGTTELRDGDVVHVPAETWFAWSGTMTIIMACSPAFALDQYEINGGEHG